MPRRRHALLLAAGFVVSLLLAVASVPATDSRATARTAPTRPAAATDPPAGSSPDRAAHRPRPPEAPRPGHRLGLPELPRETTTPVAGPGPARPAGRHSAPQRREKVAYLTFDDGPGPATRPVLRILTAHGATATFFVLGSQAARHPELVRAVRRQGSAVGFHSHDHPRLTGLRPRELRHQTRPGFAARCFRPPYGATDRRVRAAVRAAGMRQVMWTADGRDWERPGPRAITRNSLLDLRPGSILLLHDGGGDRSQTVASLPGLLERLRSRGYEVRALPYC